MLRWKFLLATPAATALLFAQSLADEANKNLPPWLHVGGEYRARVEGAFNRNFTTHSDTYFLNRLRLDLRIQPLPWMKFVFQGQDVRIFFNQQVPDAIPYYNPLDLRIGYAEFGNPDHGPVTLRAGRQEINLGDQRLLGSSQWVNEARSFDAVRTTLRHGGYRLDVLIASVVVPSTTAFDQPQAGNNLHGLYGGLEKLIPDSVIEPYVLWRLAPRQTAENGAKANLDSKTFGVRWVGKLRRFDYGTEMALQTGSLGPDTVKAWAGHWVAGYKIRNVHVSAEYNYASGDRDPHDGRRETFDQLYATAHDKYGLTDQLGWRNLRDFKAGWDTRPKPNLTIWSNFHDWWLASPRDAMYAGNSAVFAVLPDGSGGTHVGEEIDLQAAYAFSKQLQLGIGFGHIFPGEFLKSTTPGRSYTYPYLMLNYSFQ